MKRSKLLSVLGGLSVTASMLAAMIPAQAAVQTVNFTDDFSAEVPKVCDSSTNVVYEKAYTDTALTALYSSFAAFTGSTAGTSGYITYKVGGEISDFKIDVAWNNYANLGIWKIALSDDGENWTEYEAYNSTSSVVTDKIKDESGTVTGSVTTPLTELQDPSIPDLKVSVDSAQVKLASAASTSPKTYNTMHFTPGAELAKGMCYLRITVPEIGLDGWVNRFARGIYNVSIDYAPGAKASVENSGGIQKGEPIEVNFSKKMLEIPAPVVKNHNGIEKAVNYELSADGMSCIITPQTELAEGQYTVEFTGGTAEDGDEYGLNAAAEFTVVDLIPGDKIFTDDFGYSDGVGDITKIYIASDDIQVITGTTGYSATKLSLDASLATTSDSYALGAGPSLAEPYIIYKLNGSITDFVIKTRTTSNAAHDQKFKYYVSADGEEWTPLVSNTDYSVSTEYLPGYINVKTYTSADGKIPDGMNYLKIAYPAADPITDSETGNVSYSAGWGSRKLLDVSIGYNIPGTPDYEVTNGSFAEDGAGGCTYSADFTSNKADVNVIMLLAVYDSNGLVSVSADSGAAVQGTPLSMTAAVNAAEVTNPTFKVFFWDTGICPLTGVISPVTE